MNIRYFWYLKLIWQGNICVLYRTIWKDFLNGFATLQTENGEIEQMVGKIKMWILKFMFIVCLGS